MGRVYPAMAVVVVAGLIEAQAKVEIEATAVVQRRGGGVGQPAADAADRAERVVDVLLEVVDRVVERRDAELVEADQEDVPADPEHRGDPDLREHRQDDRHGAHQPAPERRGRPFAGLRQPQADVVHLHDQADAP